MLKKQSGIAIRAKNTGIRVRIVLPRISFWLISGFLICGENKTYLRIQYNVKLIRIVCILKKIRANSFLLMLVTLHFSGILLFTFLKID